MNRYHCWGWADHAAWGNHIAMNGSAIRCFKRKRLLRRQQVGSIYLNGIQAADLPGGTVKQQLGHIKIA